ncbi:S-type pyocin domain-containing protein [Vibrio parahaemolyticus]|uniref:S-type pyocin domain-containing protein n=1 Tax=Vibrio parahaemolyticus TaxID=670 RepID=UPI001121C19B|nr:S-type pyocin domain-containing protein [Vibrio parahaemolyticus]TOF75861.1 S-type Pyocin domain-containing protein [Vibrio parahaemolyticus]
MTHELGLVESDFDNLDTRALRSVANGENFSSFIEKLKQGDLVLLCDSPLQPAFSKQGAGGQWCVSSSGSKSLSPYAQNALLARSSHKATSTTRQVQVPYRFQQDDVPYNPEPPRPDYIDKELPLNYEYSFEIACSAEAFSQRLGCHFFLAKTKEEKRLTRWTTKKTERGTCYTVLAAVNEPKRLVVEMASCSMGISHTDSVELAPIGFGIVKDAFIPVTPSVQVGERLGLALEGYYYHFNEGQLVQEYKIVQENKDVWVFQATDSTHNRLDDSQLINRVQSVILVYWKIAGKVANNQHLIYLSRQITRDELDNLNDDWLNEHGVKLDIPALLDAVKQPVIEHDCSQVQSVGAYGLPPTKPQIFNHPLNCYYCYSGWGLGNSRVKAINDKSTVHQEVSVVNIKTLSSGTKITDYGKAALLALPANGTATNLGILSSNTTNTIGTWSISGEALAGFARMGGFLVAALWPSQLGDGTLDGNPDFATGDTTTMSARFNMYTDENGKQQVVGIKTGDGSAYGERVAKREAVKQGQHFVAGLENGITITWTPDGSTDVLTPDTVLPENDQLDVHNIWVRPIEEHQQEIGTVLYPEEELAEYIVTFPADAGLPPLYLVLRKTARDESGVVTGSGEDVTGIWLEKASEGLGSPVPSQIANKLRGKEFSSFDAFRKAFWIEVSKDASLLEQFNESNKERIMKGYAPRARKKDSIGGRKSFELHHKEEIQHGGKVYHFDNIGVVTPRHHIDIHKGLK